MEDEDIEIPQYFTCPISLQIMKDPVTAITGITYDRDSIEQWLSSTGNRTCPVTKQPLPPHSDLTPNHTLRRLIQSWCSEYSSLGAPQIPTPDPPLTNPRILILLKHLTQPRTQLQAIKRLATLATESDQNRKLMADSPVSRAVFEFVSTSCSRRDRTEGLEEALTILMILDSSIEHSSTDHIMDSLTWVLASDKVEPHHKTLGIHVLKSIVTNPSNNNNNNNNILTRLKPELFASIVGVLGSDTRRQTQNAALEVILELAPYKNMAGLVESGAVRAAVEVELAVRAEERRRTTELVFGVLQRLCCCAEGRARLVGHRGGVAVVAERIRKVSSVVDHLAVMILYLLSRFSGTKQVTREMLEVGAVQKLYVLLRVDCDVYLKERVREILKAHSHDWKHSPCI